ncbi:hypothetical protein yfred0001_32560 [Yersinia frederiksenii ATCC 33641]|nr:hypothetical protein yfred0001_32560 [Yersinia frederiksenii ATCC 33641]
MDLALAKDPSMSFLPTDNEVKLCKKEQNSQKNLPSSL